MCVGGIAPDCLTSDYKILGLIFEGNGTEKKNDIIVIFWPMVAV